MKPKERILRPNKLKTIGYLLISILFVVGIAFTLEEDALMGWIAISLFGIGVIVFIIQMLPDSTYLKLTKDGFEVRNLFRSHFTAWCDVKVFRIGYISTRYGRKKMVMFDYEKTHKKHTRGKAIAKYISGSHSALPDSYGMTKEELVKLMNERKNNDSV